MRRRRSFRDRLRNCTGLLWTGWASKSQRMPLSGQLRWPVESALVLAKLVHHFVEEQMPLHTSQPPSTLCKTRHFRGC
ncbi:MAG: hypothetical protein FWD46_02540 [Cystobacterineae bacterium]|nr:hypothetical protein [Cystobacterineae bacterium]